MKYFKVIPALLIFIIITSCSDLLEENPESFISTGSFYTSESDAVAAINSLYSDFTDDHGRNSYHLNALTTDEGIPGPGEGNPHAYTLNNYTFGPENGIIEEFWEDHYRIISIANTAIEMIPDIEMDEELKNRLLGEARFMRALSYFRLVRFFGDVPLLTEPIQSVQNIESTRTPVDEVYEQIVSDFTFSEKNLDSANNTELGRPSISAAKGLLVKVYLTREDWNMASEKANELIAPGNYRLMDEFANVFRPQTQPNSENIFEYNFVAGNSASDQQFELKYYMPRNTIPSVRGLGAYLPSQDIYESFDEGDLRRDWTLFTTFETDNGEVITFPPHWHKHWDSETTDNTSDNNSNIPVIRYADILLMYAESINELNGPTPAALEAVNKVRRRAYGYDIYDDSSPVDLSQNINQNEFREAIWKERKLEFAGERHRWYDLKRTHRLIPVVSDWLNKNSPGSTIQEHHSLLPIPQSEIDNNSKLTQNPGY